ncbi:major facilitator superfamily domain-containing protein [Rhodotorula diobovata]|uniref:Major facilitator superfamily domain-containing protein n=1 Tax=Rhodotorula diobovata TaxID=5288 RepID=A0A5C5FSU9_9BASI|nr:major facilitator superfamily domain-containing protein [Rhodotorula diobovata]
MTASIDDKLPEAFTGGEKGSSLNTSQQDSADFTDAEWALDKAAVRRLDWTVLPLCAITYLLNFLDRSNIGNAKVAGLAVDLQLTSHQYLVCITATYVLYIAAELPSNLVLKKIGAHIMLPLMVTTWGLCCCFTGFVQSYGGLVAARLILGLLEGGLFPGLVLYLSMFYRRHELQTRISLFFSAASLSGAFSGLLAAGIVNLDGKGGYAGWRYIFFLEGGFTVLFGIVLFFLLPRSPAHSRFLTAEQRAHIDRRLKLDTPAGASNDFDTQFSWREVRMALTSPQVLLILVALFGNGLTLYGFSYFTPVIVQNFGYSPIKTQLLTVPPFFLAFLVTLVNARISDRYGQRGLCAILMSILALVGYIMFNQSMAMAVRYTALFLAITGVYSTSPALVTWLPNNSAGHYRKATAVALGFVSTNTAGICSTWLFPANQGPEYRQASSVLIAFVVIIIVFCCLNLAYLRYANQKKAERRAEAGGVIDASTWSAEGDRHPHFVYSY